VVKKAKAITVIKGRALKQLILIREGVLRTMLLYAKLLV